MSLLDLGFSSFEAAEAIVKGTEERSISHKWICDWLLISFLNKITFLCDATMYRLYCSEYNIECDYTDEECAELACKYKDQIYAFQSDLMFKLINDIYTKWVSFVDSGKIVPHLPPTAKVALMNFMSIVGKMAESELAPHLISLYASQAEAHKARTTYTADISDVQEYITKDQFKSFCEIFKQPIEKAFAFKSKSLDQKLFNIKISLIQKVLMSILWLCEPKFIEHISSSDSPDEIFDKWLFPYIKEASETKEYVTKFSSHKNVPLAYALCITPENIDIVPEDRDAYPITDSFRFMCTLTYTQFPTEINK